MPLLRSLTNFQPRDGYRHVASTKLVIEIRVYRCLPPISPACFPTPVFETDPPQKNPNLHSWPTPTPRSPTMTATSSNHRSEERRVGKDSSSMSIAKHSQKNTPHNLCRSGMLTYDTPAARDTLQIVLDRHAAPTELDELSTA